MKKKTQNNFLVSCRLLIFKEMLSLIQSSLFSDICSSFQSFRLNSYDISLEILFAGMIVFDKFIGSISITFVLVLLFVIIHNLNSK